MQISRPAIPRILLALLIVADLIFSAWLFQGRGGGFFAPHGDEVARAAIGYQLCPGRDFPPGSIFRHWRNAPGPFPHKVWCPLQFFLIALAYTLTGDLLISPFVVNSLFAAGALAFLYATIRKASPRNPWLALAGAAAYAALPAVKVVDISGLDQTILNFFLIAGVFFWVRATPTNFVWLLAASVAFLLASATRFEGWFGAAIFAGWILLRMIAPRPAFPRRRLITPMVISLLFIVVWSAWQAAHFGRLEYFSYHRAEALLGRDKLFLEKSAGEKIAFYPRLLVRSSPAVAIFALVGLACFRRLSRPARLVAIFALAEFLILTVSAFSVGVPHGAERLLATNLLLFLPVAVAGLEALIELLLKKRASSVAAILVLVFAAFSARSVPSSLHNSIPDEIFRIGRFLERSAVDGTIGPGERVYVEYAGVGEGREWDTQKISLFAPALAVTNPRFSWDESGEWISARMKEDRIALAVVWSEGARKRLPEFMRELLVSGPYTVYGNR